jgi:hypothetical protein
MCNELVLLRILLLFVRFRLEFEKREGRTNEEGVEVEERWIF